MSDNLFAPLDNISTPGVDETSPVQQAQEQSLFAPLQGASTYKEAETAALQIAKVSPIDAQEADLIAPIEVPQGTGMGLFQKTRRSLLAGIGDTIEGFGDAFNFIGLTTGANAISALTGGSWYSNKIGDTLKEFGSSMAEKYTVEKSEEIQDFTWDDLANAEFWATSVARTIPFTLSLFIPGGVGAKVGTKMATTLAKYAPTLANGLGKTITSKGLTKLPGLKALQGATAKQIGTKALGATGGFLGAGTAMTAIDGAVIAGETLETSYNQFIQEGYTPEQAQNMAAEVASSVYIDNQASFLIESLSYATVVGGITGKGLRRTLGFGARNTAKEFGIKAAAITTAGGIEATTEMYQETYQEWIKGKARAEVKGEDYMSYLDFFNSEEAKETKGISFASGLLFGSVGQVINNVAERKALLANDYDLLAAKIDPAATDLTVNKQERIRSIILDNAIDGRLGNTEELTNELVDAGVMSQEDANLVFQTAKQVNKAFNETPSVDLSRMKPNEKRELAAAYLKRQESENKIKDLESVFADEINKINNLDISQEQKEQKIQELYSLEPNTIEQLEIERQQLNQVNEDIVSMQSGIYFQQRREQQAQQRAEEQRQAQEQREQERQEFETAPTPEAPKAPTPQPPEGVEPTFGTPMSDNEINVIDDILNQNVEDGNITDNRADDIAQFIADNNMSFEEAQNYVNQQVTPTPTSQTQKVEQKKEPKTKPRVVQYKGRSYTITSDGTIINQNTNRKIKPDGATGKAILKKSAKPRFEDNQVPVKREYFTVTSRDGDVQKFRVTTRLDGSRNWEILDGDMYVPFNNGKIADKNVIERDNLSTRQELDIFEQAGDVVTTDQTEGPDAIMNPKMKADLSEDQFNRVYKSQEVSTVESESKAVSKKGSLSDLVSAWLQTPEGSLENQTAEESAAKFAKEYLKRGGKETEQQIEEKGLAKSIADQFRKGVVSKKLVLEEIQKQQGLLEGTPVQLSLFEKTKKILKPKRTNTTKRKQKGRKSIADDFREKAPLQYKPKYSYRRAGTEIALRDYLKSKFPSRELRFVDILQERFGLNTTGYAIGTSAYVNYKVGENGELVDKSVQKAIMHEFGHFFRDIHINSEEVQALLKSLPGTSLFENTKNGYFDQILYATPKGNKTGADIFFEANKRNPNNKAEYDSFINSLGLEVLPDSEQEIILDEAMQALLEDPLLEKYGQVFGAQKPNIISRIKDFFDLVNRSAPQRNKAVEILNETANTKGVPAERFIRRIINNFRENPNIRQAHHPRGRFSRSKDNQNKIVEQIKNIINNSTFDISTESVQDYYNKILDAVLQIPGIDILTESQIKNRILGSLFYPIKETGIKKLIKDFAVLQEQEAELLYGREEDINTEYAGGNEEESISSRMSDMVTDFLETFSTKERPIYQREVLSMLYSTTQKYKDDFYGFVDFMQSTEDTLAAEFMDYVTFKYNENPIPALRFIHQENRNKRFQKFMMFTIDPIVDDEGNITNIKVNSRVSRNSYTYQSVSHMLAVAAGNYYTKNRTPEMQAVRKVINDSLKGVETDTDLAYTVLEALFGNQLDIYNINLFEEDILKPEFEGLLFEIDGKLLSMGEVFDLQLNKTSSKQGKFINPNIKSAFRPILQQIFDATVDERYQATTMSAENESLNTVSKHNSIFEISEILQSVENDELIQKLYKDNHLIDALLEGEINLVPMPISGGQSRLRNKIKKNYNKLSANDFTLMQMLMQINALAENQQVYLQSAGQLSDTKNNYFFQVPFLSEEQIKKETNRIIDKLQKNGSKYGNGEFIFPFLEEVDGKIKLDIRSTTQGRDELIKYIQDNKSYLENLDIIKEQLPDIFEDINSISTETLRNVQRIQLNQIINQFQLQEIFIGNATKNKSSIDFVKRAKRAGAKHIPLGEETRIDLTVLEDFYVLNEDVNSQYLKGTIVGEATLERITNRSVDELIADGITSVATDSGAYITDVTAKKIRDMYGNLNGENIAPGTFKFVGAGIEIDNVNIFGEDSYLKSNVGVLTEEFVTKHPEYKYIYDILVAREQIADANIGVGEMSLPVVYHKSGSKVLPKGYPVFRRNTPIEDINTQLNNILINDGNYGFSGLNYGVQLDLDIKRYSSQRPEQAYAFDLINLSDEMKSLVNNMHKKYMQATMLQFNEIIGRFEVFGNDAINVSEKIFGSKASRLSSLAGKDLPGIFPLRDKSIAKKFGLFGSKIQTPGGIGTEASTIGNEWKAYTSLTELIKNSSGEYKRKLQLLNQKYGNIRVSEVSLPATFGNRRVGIKEGDLIFGSRIPTHGKQTRVLFVVKEILQPEMGNQTFFNPYISEIMGSDKDGDQIYFNGKFANPRAWQNTYNQGFDLEVQLFGSKEVQDELKLQMSTFAEDNQKAIDNSNKFFKLSTEQSKPPHRLRLLGNKITSKTNLESSPLIGFAANAQRLFSYFLRYNIKLPATFTITGIDGVSRTFSEFDTIYNKDEGVANFIEVAKILNTVLDEPAHQKTEELGYDEITLSHAIILSYMGIPTQDIITLFKSPIYKEYSRLSKPLSLFEQQYQNKPDKATVKRSLFRKVTSIKPFITKGGKRRPNPKFDDAYKKFRDTIFIGVNKVNLGDIVLNKNKKDVLKLLYNLEAINQAALGTTEYMGIHNGIQSSPHRALEIVVEPQSAFKPMFNEESGEVQEFLQSPKVQHNLNIIDRLSRWHFNHSKLFDLFIGGFVSERKYLKTPDNLLNITRRYSEYIAVNTVPALQNLYSINEKSYLPKLEELVEKYGELEFFSKATLFQNDEVLKDGRVIQGIGLVSNQEYTQDLAEQELERIGKELQDNLTQDEINLLIQYDYLSHQFGTSPNSVLHMMPYSTLREIKLGYLGYRSSAETIEKFEEDMIDSVLFEPEFGAIQEWRDGKRRYEFEITEDLDSYVLEADNSVTLSTQVIGKSVPPKYVKLFDKTTGISFIYTVNTEQDTLGDYKFYKEYNTNEQHIIKPSTYTEESFETYNQTNTQERKPRGRFKRNLGNETLKSIKEVQQKIKEEDIIPGDPLTAEQTIDIENLNNTEDVKSFRGWLESALLDRDVTEILNDESLINRYTPYYNNYVEQKRLMNAIEKKFAEVNEEGIPYYQRREEFTDELLRDHIQVLQLGGMDYRATEDLYNRLVEEMAQRATSDQHKMIQDKIEGYEQAEPGARDISVAQAYMLANNIDSRNEGVQFLQRKFDEEYKRYISELNEKVKEINTVHQKLVESKNKSFSILQKVRAKFAPNEFYEHYYGNIYYESPDGIALRPLDNIKRKDGDSIVYYRDKNGSIIQGINQLNLTKEERDYWNMYKETTESTRKISNAEMRDNYIPNIKMSPFEALQSRGLFGLFMLTNRGINDIGVVEVLGTNPETGERILLPFEEFQKLYGYGNVNNSVLKDIESIREYKRLEKLAQEGLRRGMHMSEDGKFTNRYFNLRNTNTDAMQGGDMFYRYSNSRSVKAKAFGTKNIHRALLEHVKSTYYTFGTKEVGGKFGGMIEFMPLVDGLIRINENEGNKNIVMYLTKLYKEGQLLQKKQEVAKGVDPVVDGFVKYTMYITLALNIPAGIFNVAVGKYNEIRKRGVGKFAKGEARFWGIDRMLKGDFEGTQTAFRKSMAILKKTAFMTHSLYDLVPSTPGTLNFAGKSIDDILFMVMQGSENWIQGAAFLGELTEEEWNSYDVNGNLLENMPGITPTRQSEIEDKVRKVHGRGYSPTDQRLIQMYSLGRAFMQHKRWLPTYIMDRFGRDQINKYGEREIGSYVAGAEYAREATKFARKVLNNEMSTAEAIEELRNMPKYKREAAYAALRGLGMTMMLSAILFSLKAAGQDDDDPLYHFVSRTVSDALLIFDTPKFTYFMLPPSLQTFENAMLLARYSVPVSQKEFGFAKMKRKGRYADRGEWKGTTPLVRLLPFNKISRQIMSQQDFDVQEVLFK